MLLHTAIEEIGHVGMLATAVAPNRDKTPVSEQQAGAAHRAIGSIMGGGDTKTKGVIDGMLQRHTLSSGLSACPAKSDGMPLDLSHICASGNLAADMYCNVTTKSTGGVLTCRLLDVTTGIGMRETLAFNISRDTTYQQQWLAVIEVGRYERGLQRSPPRADRRRTSR